MKWIRTGWKALNCYPHRFTKHIPLPKPKSLVELIDIAREGIICTNVKSIHDISMIHSNGIARAADMLHNVTKSVSEFIGGIIKGEALTRASWLLIWTCS